MTGAATLHLALGFSLGAVVLAAKAAGVASPLWLLRETHIHLLVFGWLAQFAMGVALAIFPRLASGPPRGDPRAAWVCFGLLNLGVVSGAVSPLAAAMGWTAASGGLLGLAGACDVLAVAVFARVMWARVRTVNPVWPTDLPVMRGP
ncbi:MAG: hypothetical protein ABIQ99_10055 [Thermoflexales bacterium]